MTRAVVRDDGRVVLVTERGLVLVDPATGAAVETALKAVAITTDGAFAVNFPHQSGKENSTAAEIIDIASGQRVTGPVDGVLLDFVEHTDGNIALLRRAGSTDVLLLDPHDGTLGSAEPLGDLSAATSPELASSAQAVFVDEAVEVGLYSLRDALRFECHSRPRMSRKYPSPLAIGPHWPAKSAGRQLRHGELESIVESTNGLTRGCGGPSRHPSGDVTPN